TPRSVRYNDADFQTTQLGGKSGVALRIALRRPKHKGNVLALHVTEIPQSLDKCRRRTRAGTGEITNPRDFPRLLRLDRNAKRKQHGAKRNAKDFLTQEFLPKCPFAN